MACNTIYNQYVSKVYVDPKALQREAFGFRQGNAPRACEYVSPDHCDKVCDRIGDAILDSLMTIDPECRTGLEVVGSGNTITLFGEISVSGLDDVEISKLSIEETQRVLKAVGEKNMVVDARTRLQDATIGLASRRGAGDQSICCGYASDETDSLMPSEYARARDLCLSLHSLAQDHDNLGTDGKVIVSKQGDRWVGWLRWSQTESEQLDTNHLIRERALEAGMDTVYINLRAPFPSSDCRFKCDTGVLGRKSVCDHYGPWVPIGGGAISGKDPSKVDRCGNYAARHAASAITREMGGETIVWLAFTLGEDVPIYGVFKNVDAKGRETYGELNLKEFGVHKIIERFSLTDPASVQYYDLATYGHYGRQLPWD